MKEKIDNYSWTKGFLYSGLLVVLIILSGKLIYRAMSIIEPHKAKIVSFILGIIILVLAILMLIKASKKFTLK